MFEHVNLVFHSSYLIRAFGLHIIGGALTMPKTKRIFVRNIIDSSRIDVAQRTNEFGASRMCVANAIASFFYQSLIPGYSKEIILDIFSNRKSFSLQYGDDP